MLISLIIREKNQRLEVVIEEGYTAFISKVSILQTIPRNAENGHGGLRARLSGRPVLGDGERRDVERPDDGDQRGAERLLLRREGE